MTPCGGLLRRANRPVEPNANTGLQGLRIISFESRLAGGLSELIRRYGGTSIAAPSMREVPLGENQLALEFVRRLEKGEVDVAIFLTGVGARTLIQAVAGECPRERLAALLKTAALVARGPKAAAVLKQLGLQPAITVPEPNTWREILAELDSKLPIEGRRVAVQEYGATNAEFLAALAQRGAAVTRVPVYRWALPEDTTALRSAVRKLIGGEVDAALFTNATQALHLFQIGAELGLEEKLRRGLNGVVVASIGPVCSETLEDLGVGVDVEPGHPKMGQLVAELARRGRELAAAKRGR